MTGVIMMDNSFKLIYLFMSLTYIKNNRGPSIDPCGTPHLGCQVIAIDVYIMILLTGWRYDWGDYDGCQ